MKRYPEFVCPRFIGAGLRLLPGPTSGRMRYFRLRTHPEFACEHAAPTFDDSSFLSYLLETFAVAKSSAASLLATGHPHGFKSNLGHLHSFRFHGLSPLCLWTVTEQATEDSRRAEWLYMTLNRYPARLRRPRSVGDLSKMFQL